MTGIVAAIVAGSLAGIWLSSPWCWLAVLCVAPGSVHLLPVRAAVFLLSVVWADYQLTQVLDARIVAPTESEVTVRVVGIPRVGERSVGFLVVAPESGFRYSLRWYKPEFALQSGDTLRATVRLNPVRGTFNRRGFDFEAWATGERIIGTGFVKAVVRVNSEPGAMDRIHRIRSNLSLRLHTTFDGPAGRLFPALAVADRQYLSQTDRAVLGSTGTAHLLAISGLHIGLVAGLGFIIARVLWSVWLPTIPRQVFCVALGITFAIAYAGLAGFTVSTQRALVMLLVSGLVLMLRQPLRPGITLLTAAAVVLLFDPLSSISAGFWLSFGAVSVLVLLALMSPTSRGRGRLQLLLTLGMAPLTLVFGFRLALVSPLANLVAIPWVGVLVVPLMLSWMLLDAVSPGAGEWAAPVVAWPVDALYHALGWLTGISGETIVPLRHPSAVLLALGFLMLILPSGLRLRAPGGLVLLMTVLHASPRREVGDLTVHVLDVGQGQAILVETSQHALLYDTGPGSSTGWEAGSSLVVPYLQSLGLGSVDRTIVSHGDSDHSAGFSGIVAMDVKPGDVLSSDRRFGRPCLAGESWTWDGVQFSILHPGPGLPYLGNDSSCVLRIDSDGLSVLIPGDVSSVVESRLSRNASPVDVLVAAHHGSGSSTSAEFLHAFDPGLVVFSRGAYNRFAMPHVDVMDRVAGRNLADTAQCGGLIIANGQEISVIPAREPARRWHAAPLTDMPACAAPEIRRRETSAAKSSMIPARLLSNP